MRTRLCLFLLSLAAQLPAQSPLQTNLIAGNQGNFGGGLYFDLEVHSTVSLTRIDSWVSSVSATPGSLVMECWLTPETYFGNLNSPAMWSRIESATATGFVPNQAYQLLEFTFAAPLTLGPGRYGVALQSQAQGGAVPWGHAYTNGTSCTSSQVPGSCFNTLHGNLELTARGGAAQNVFLTGSIFTPRMWAGSLHYTPGGTPIQLATTQNFGSGCAGSGGVPRLAPGSRPVLGRDFVVDVHLAPANSPIGFAVLGLSNTAWYYVPLPLDLGFHGMPGCRQYTDILTTTGFAVSPTLPDLQYPIPGAGILAGQRFYLQAIVVDPSPQPGNQRGMVTTDALAGVIGL